MTKIQLSDKKEKAAAALANLPEPVPGSWRRRNNSSFWTKCGIAVCGILITFAALVIVFLVLRYTGCLSYYNQPNKNGGQSRNGPSPKQQTPITMDDLFDSRFRPRSVGATWDRTTNVVSYRDVWGNLLEHNLDTLQIQMLVPNTTFIEVGSSSYSIAADRNYVFFRYDTDYEITNKPVARAKMFRRSDGNLFDFPNDDTMRGQILMEMTWAPLGHRVTFVYEENLYEQNGPLARPVQLTTDGQRDLIQNGLSFWHTTGVNGAYQANWFSPDMNYLVYARFNASRSPQHAAIRYHDNNRVYPEFEPFAYPKAGDANAHTTVQLLVIDMNNIAGPRLEIPAPSQLVNADYYYYRTAWRDNTHFAVGWINRRQNHSVISICDVTTGACQQNSEEIVSGGWIESGYRRWRYIGDGSTYLTLLPKDEGASGKWRHLALVTSSMSDAGQVTFLTSGALEVYSISGFDSSLNVVYYIAQNIGDVFTRHLYRVGTPASNPIYQTPECLTCTMSPTCQFVRTSFSATGQYYVLSCLGPDIPSYRLMSTDGSVDVVLEDNAELRALLDTKLVPTRQYVEIDIGGGYKGSAEMVLPPGYDSSAVGAYPVVFHPYNGPQGHQQATYEYKILNSNIYRSWETYLASSENVVTVRLDGRGTGGRGYTFLYELNRRLATYEIDDQIIGGQNMLAAYPYLDPTRTAIWGKSYGGFVVSHVMGRVQEVFKCGIAVAPVTSYRYYYTGYTERYMGIDSPNDNQAGYDQTDAMRFVENFRDKKFLLVHGTLDDNVHFQNAIQLINSLSQANIHFSTVVLVDQNHSIIKSSLIRYMLDEFNIFVNQTCWPTPSRKL